MIDVTLVEMSESDFEDEKAPELVSLPLASRASLPSPGESEAIEDYKLERSVEGAFENFEKAEVSGPEIEAIELVTPARLQAHVEAPEGPKSPIRPVYPRRSRAKGEEGIVELKIEVDESGKVSSVEILSTSGFAALDKAALDAVKGVEFYGNTTLKLEFRLRK